MQIPDEVKKAMREAGRAYKKANEANEVFREWLDSEGHGEDDFILDQWIDNVEMGTNRVNEVIKFIEKEI